MSLISTENEDIIYTLYNDVLLKAYPTLKMEIKFVKGIETFKCGRNGREKTFRDCHLIILEDGVREVINTEACSLSCIIEEMIIAIARIYDENRVLAYCKENYSKLTELQNS